MLQDQSNQQQRPAQRSRSSGSSRLECIASQLSAPALNTDSPQPLPRPLSNGIATLARSMATDETIMLRVRELVAQQLMQRRDEDALHPQLQSSRSSTGGGWDVVSEASSSPFVPVDRPPAGPHQHTQHYYSPSQETSTSDQDDFEQLFSLPFRRVTSAEFSLTGTPHRAASVASATGHGQQCSHATTHARSSSSMSNLGGGVAGDPHCGSHLGGDDDSVEPPCGSVVDSAATTRSSSQAVALVEDRRNFFDLVTWSTTVVWHHVTSALRALWDAVQDNFYPLRRSTKPGWGGSKSGKSGSSGVVSEDEEARTGAFMAASAILLNAAVVYAVSQRLSVRATVEHASGIIRDVFTTGLV